MTTPSGIPLPAIDYSSRDFAGFEASVYARASQIVPDWQSRDAGDFGVVLIDILSYIGDTLSYQIDRVASETFLPTARRRESVVNIAALMGYRPTGRLAATLTLQFTAPDISTATVPAGTQVVTTPTSDTTPIYFETLTDITFPSGGISGADQLLTVEAVEGQTVSGEVVAISTGLAGQFYPLFNQPLIDGSTIVQVQDNPANAARTWSYVDNLIEAGPFDEVFSIDITDAGIALVLFGNGITGAIPTRGAQITANYRVGGGVDGNVGAGAVTEIVQTITNVTSVINTTNGVGGEDEEDIEAIRAKAPYVFSANNRAINEEDWTGLALRVPGVAKALAVAHVYNQPVIYIAPGDGTPASPTLLTNVVNFVQPLSLAGSIVRAAAATYRDIDIAATITVSPQYSAESVRQVVLQELSNLFAFNNPVGVANFGADVSQAAVYSAIINVPGVLGCALAVLADHGDDGVADIQAGPEEIPQLGTPSIVANGGITPFNPTVQIVGANPVQPTPAGAPVISTVTPPRCDTSTTHLEMTWTGGANTTLWYLEVNWVDGGAAELHGPQLFGPFSTAAAVVDVPKWTDAVSIKVRTAAYNGTTGPEYSPTTSFANPCFV